MAFLAPHFDYDVFVTYSHGDPLGLQESPLRDWTINLVRDLEADIRAVDPEFDKLGIWYDEHLDPTNDLTPELREKVRASAVLLVVMSPRYLSSRWCKDELEWFREQVADRSRDQGRVFVIRALPTDETKWPDFLRDERGYSPKGFFFYDLKSRMPFRWRGVEEHPKEFVEQLWRLQTTLIQRLRQLLEQVQSDAAHAAGPVRVELNRRIYVQARPEDIKLRETLSSRLTAQGLTPLVASATAGSSLKDWTLESRLRVEAAKRCGALALVRPESDEAFMGEVFEIGVDERERIQASRGANLPCALLDASGRPTPIDVAALGIQSIDVRQDNWPLTFQTWLQSAEPSVAGPV
jgi:hypothetical protein